MSMDSQNFCIYIPVCYYNTLGYWDKTHAHTHTLAPDNSTLYPIVSIDTKSNQIDGIGNQKKTHIDTDESDIRFGFSFIVFHCDNITHKTTTTTITMTMAI